MNLPSATPNVHVYVRHLKACKHRDRFYKKCDCPKWLSFYRQGKEHRVRVGSGRWDVAQRRARAIEDSYEARALGKPLKPAQVMTVEDAVRKFIADRRAQHLADDTIKKLETIFSKQLVEWCLNQEPPVLALTDLTLPKLQQWRATWKGKSLAAKKRQERVVGFFYFCQRNRWLSENPATELSPIKADAANVDYFRPAEMAQILAACDKFGRKDADRIRLRTLVLLLRWSGLAIRDAVTLERTRLDEHDRLILRRAKTGVPVFCPLQPSVASALRSIPDANHSNARYFFWSGEGLPKSCVADWQRALRRLFVLADLKHEDGTKKRCFPHMFRHSFSIEMLLAGVPIDDVATLLGHNSVRTTEKYYSGWVRARAERLEKSVREAWVS